jgi:hypothetical protein
MYFVHSVENNFSQNTIVEDYAKNLINMAKSNKRVLLLPEGDAQLFSVRYAQLVLSETPDIFTGNIRLLFNEWFVKKIKIAHPDFKFDSKKISSNKILNIENDFLAPNIDNFIFVFTRDINVQGFKTTYMPLGRRIGKGEGIFFDNNVNIKINTNISQIKTPLKNYNSYRDIYSEYAFYYLRAGLENINHGYMTQSLRSFQNAKEIVPYCVPALINLCLIEKCSNRNYRIMGIYNYY